MWEIRIYVILSATPPNASVSQPHIRIGEFESEADAIAKRDTLWFSSGAAFVTDVARVGADGSTGAN